MEPSWQQGGGDDLSPIAGLLAGILAIAVVILSGWMTIVAFVGGTMPILGWETEGGLGTGLLWLLFVDPIVITVMIWLSTAVTLAVDRLAKQAGSSGGSGPDRGEGSDRW
ncbi:hypothetical protein [Rhabdothermincola sediminis]|uniref:hypothetical protein n=1 Tax=Rhabdothermincola sediminis TaxID=2751370 RepID=UPI001AA08BDA|nr:hypothetical protein [Rhabdothermincola sediminis]